MLRKRTLKLSTKWILSSIPLLLAVILYIVLPFSPYFCEYIFARGIFRVVAVPLNFLVSISPFSLTECVVVLFLPFLLTISGLFIYRFIKYKEDRRNRLEKALRRCFTCVSVAALVYMLMHGGNYNRLPIGQLMQLEDAEYTATFLKEVTTDLAKKASAAREQVAEDENGMMIVSDSLHKALLDTDDCFNTLRQSYPFFKSGTWRVKSVFLSPYWSYTGITGVYCPWLAESNVNTDIPHSELLFTATHEYAHTMGFAKEDACNFIAYLGCIHSQNPDYIYAGYLGAYIYCSNALYKYDKGMCKDTVAYCSQGVLRDLQQRSTYWKGFSGQVMDTSEQLNDTFIKVNGDKNGVLSYGEVVSLILRYYDTYAILE